MIPQQSYIIDIIIIASGVLSVAYILYGRIKSQPLIKPWAGEYKPGTTRHRAFLKFVNNSKLLAVITAATLFFIANAALDARTILHSSSSHSILTTAPILVIVGFIIMLAVFPIIFNSKR